MEAALRALSDPGRRRILTLVRDEEHSAGEIAAEFTVSWPAVSQHLRVLREAQLVTERREGTRRIYSLNPGGLLELRTYFDQFWDQMLADFKTAAEREE
jgi:DNA-binding transcriptional ArsR family regulator